MAVWNAARQQRWQEHKVPEKTLCLESVSTFVYLGSDLGQIHFTDLQKFPLRTKDNSLLVTSLYSDPLSEPITGKFQKYNKGAFTFYKKINREKQLIIIARVYFLNVLKFKFSSVSFL